MKFYFTLPVFLLLPVLIFGKSAATTFRLSSGQSPAVFIEASEEAVVHSAYRMLCEDYQSVLGAAPRKSDVPLSADILIASIDKNSPLLPLVRVSYLDSLRAHKEAFILTVMPYAGKPRLWILGSDKRGTAYGILELSRLLGVSPWVWWADATPVPLPSIELKNNFYTFQYPSVEFRGIFINDEDWGLNPWSWQTYEPSTRKGQIGPKTHARIFELLLRLRANTFWPAMHECSIPFYFTPGNQEMADQYGIYISTSHCEPMMRNTNGEWKTAGKGEYDYVHNHREVEKFWEKRVQETAHSDNIYTLGMRGVHDGKMQGAKTIAEQKEALTRILTSQRQMLARRVRPDVENIPQLFIPYKEVLDVYHAGLEVPDDVTLMWCDDNYGYIRHQPDSVERQRKGGNGVYYHISYWGRPHDYLWLSTTHPALIYHQMKTAYDRGARKIWILNVGDIKPAEYQTELFLDLAWQIDNFQAEQLSTHLAQWLSREFGPKIAPQLLPLMQEYYRLAYIRKPEFLGNTRVEEKNPQYKVISDLPWSESEIRERLGEYRNLADEVARLSRDIPAGKQDCWLQLVKYPLLACQEMNKKLLYAQLARHGKADWQLSDAAYDSIVSLTQAYNRCNNGKWNRLMDFRPRNLPVFQVVPHRQASGNRETSPSPRKIFNGTEYSSCTGSPRWSGGLGYQNQAVVLPAGAGITFRFKHRPSDTLRVETCLLPTHSQSGKSLQYQIQIDDEAPQIVDFHTQGRSEEWKLNVLRNQAIRHTQHRVKKARTHRLTIRALDEEITVDQIKIF